MTEDHEPGTPGPDEPAPGEAPARPPPPPPDSEAASGELDARGRYERAGVRAELDRRFLAAFIDGLIAFVAGFVPSIGWLLALVYWLVRDGLEADFMDQRSIGKKLLKIRPVRLDGTPTDVTDSIRRNWMFAVTGIIQYLWFVPLGFLLAVPLTIVLVMFVGVEIYLVVTEPEGRRIGDRIAGTVVIDVQR